MLPANNPDATISNERVLSASARRVFSAFEQPDQLARWWGPRASRTRSSGSSSSRTGGGSS